MWPKTAHRARWLVSARRSFVGCTGTGAQDARRCGPDQAARPTPRGPASPHLGGGGRRGRTRARAGARADRRHEPDQGRDRRDADHRDHAREVGYHHAQVRRAHVHAARAPAHHRRDPPAARRPRARAGVARRAHRAPDRGARPRAQTRRPLPAGTPAGIAYGHATPAQHKRARPCGPPAREGAAQISARVEAELAGASAAAETNTGARAPAAGLAAARGCACVDRGTRAMQQPESVD